MSEVGAADRSRLLRSKRSELSGIVTSRKRKIREFFAVCDTEEPLPRISGPNLDTPPATPAEERFLDVSDILKDRIFDESNLPTRRQLRSSTLKRKSKSPCRKPSPDARTIDAARKAKVQRDGSRVSKSRASTPSARSDGGRTTPVVEIDLNAKAVPDTQSPTGRPVSKGSKNELPTESSAVLDEIVEETFEDARQPEPEVPDTLISPKDLESDRVQTVLESRPNSPGVDPRKAMPISPDDAAELSQPLVNGLTSHDPNHKAVTVHLPPKEVQERRIREAKQAREEAKKEPSRLAIAVSPDGARLPEPLSSPGSTVGALSATSPALHDASTDTSPDNESSRYDVDRLEKDEEPRTPMELKPTFEEVAEKEEHDRILTAQIDIVRADILASSPTAADKQLRMEEEAASLNAPDEQSDEDLPDAETVEAHRTADTLTKNADEGVQEVVNDTEPAAGTPPMVDVPMSGVEVPPEAKETEALQPGAKSSEVPDSDAEGHTPVDAMEVDTTTVKDSFESSDVVESRTATSAAAPEQIDAAEAPVADSKTPSDTLTASQPRIPLSTPNEAPVERMTTRVASGAMRHKSVSEILGEIPRPNTVSNLGRNTVKGASDSGSTEYSASLSRSLTPGSPGARIRSLVEKAKERERSKLSTVTFSRRPPKSGSNDTALMPIGSQAAKAPKEDYLKPLFITTATSDKRGVPALDSLLGSAHKTITTSNAYLPILESQTSKVLKRIYNLQSSNKWSLRQPKRAVEPYRPTTHWDVLIQEAKWMRTDFREERKWKMAVASNLASACAEWVAASPEDRLLLQVKTIPPTELPILGESANETETTKSSSQNAPRSTPDLVPSGENDSSLDDFEEDLHLNLMDTVAPTAIFALQDDDVVFGLRRSPTADKLLDELPMYGSQLVVPQSDLPTSELDPDRSWRRPALPLSKYIEGRIELKSEPSPRKKSRFEYEDDEGDDDEVVFGEPGHKRPILPPEQTDVALFNPEHKHILDRMHSLHQFRPPSEFPMPLQSFFETRVASQWTWDEDNELQTLVREYSYNWSLISSMLASKSMFSSGAERRTPWECFERWIHLEGLPPDMQKTHYFRAYTTRIEAANRNVTAQAQAHAQATTPQQAAANGQIQPPPKRRTTGSVRVERRRNQKHLTLVDAMRKLAKKRETSIQKQAQAAGMAALRKANENNHAPQRGPIHTPQDFSRIKHEREEQLRERMLLMQQRQEAQKRAQRNAAQNPQQAGIPPGGSQPRGVSSASGSLVPNGTSNSAGQNLTVPGQNRQPRPMPQMGQPIPNGLRVPQPPMNGISPSPMQAMQGQMPMPNPAVSVGLINQAARTAEEQRAMIQMQQQGKLPGQSPQIHNSPPRMNGMPQPGFQVQNMMAFNANTNGVPTPPINNVVPSTGQGHGQGGSPRIGQHAHGQESQNTHIARLEAHFKKQYPNASQDQIMALMTDALKRNAQSKQGLAQSAMNAAAGGGTSMGGINGQGPRMPVGVESSPQLYAQMLRQQQENQQKAEQARQAANVMAAQAQNTGVASNGQQDQGHAHRNSSGSIQSTN